MGASLEGEELASGSGVTSEADLLGLSFATLKHVVSIEQDVFPLLVTSFSMYSNLILFLIPVVAVSS